MIKLKVPKGLGYQVASLIRQLIMCSVNTGNIVAYKLDGKNELLQSQGIDLVKFPAELQKLRIIHDSNLNYPMPFNVEFTNVLTVKDLINAGIPIKDANPEDILLMDFSGRQRSIEFIINEGASFLTAEENRELVEKNFHLSTQYFQFMSTSDSEYIVKPIVVEGLHYDEVSISIYNGDSDGIIEQVKIKINEIFSQI